MVVELSGAAGAVPASGMTMAIVTHEMSFARRVANWIAFMDGGRIVEIATPEVFFRAPRTERAKAFLDAIKDPFSD